MHLLVFNHIGQGPDRSGLRLANFLEGSGLGEIRKYPPEGRGPFAETASASIYRLHAKRQSQFSENPLFLVIKSLHGGCARFILHALPERSPGSGFVSSRTRSVYNRSKFVRIASYLCQRCSRRSSASSSAARRFRASMISSCSRIAAAQRSRSLWLAR
jgi:hypothetical protein